VCVCVKSSVFNAELTAVWSCITTSPYFRGASQKFPDSFRLNLLTGPYRPLRSLHTGPSASSTTESISGPPFRDTFQRRLQFGMKMWSVVCSSAISSNFRPIDFINTNSLFILCYALRKEVSVFVGIMWQVLARKKTGFYFWGHSADEAQFSRHGLILLKFVGMYHMISL
jgi:hypothetical protein